MRLATLRESFNWHSQKRSTVRPCLRSILFTAKSLFRLRSILLRQYAAFDFGLR